MKVGNHFIVSLINFYLKVNVCLVHKKISGTPIQSNLVTCPSSETSATLLDSAGWMNLPDTVTGPAPCCCNCRILSKWIHPGRWGRPVPWFARPWLQCTYYPLLWFERLKIFFLVISGFFCWFLGNI